MKRVYIIVGGARPHWLGKRIAQWVRVTAKSQTKAVMTIVDADDIVLQSDQEQVEAVPNRKKYDLSEADGYILITPEYESGKDNVIQKVVAALKQDETHEKPVAFVSYGLNGGYNLVDKLRTQVKKINLAPLRRAVHIVKPWDVIDEAGELHDEAQEQVLKQMIKQLSGWMALAGRTV